MPYGRRFACPHFSVPPYHVCFPLPALRSVPDTTFYYWDYYTIIKFVSGGYVLANEGIGNLNVCNAPEGVGKVFSFFYFILLFDTQVLICPHTQHTNHHFPHPRIISRFSFPPPLVP